MSRSVSAPLLLAFAFLTLVVLTACARATQMVNDKAAAEAYIRANITALSPEPAVLGGTFYVTDIRWEDDDTVIVDYEDGHIALRGKADVTTTDDATTVGALTIVEENPPPAGQEASSDASSRAGRAPSKLGEFCGGIAAFQCEEGLECEYDGTYPDAGGTCVEAQ